MVEDDGVSILARLRDRARSRTCAITSDYDRLDAVVISHMHADHFLDLIPLRYALKYGRVAAARAACRCICRPAASDATHDRERPSRAKGNGDFLDEVFDVRTYGPEEEVRIGDARLHVRRNDALHPVVRDALRAWTGAA